ncbi:myo-inosose-2 dehydratase [Maritimibacter dapengensis]|uniref:Myo-inosose-2 dehydratase n=1 Tax=Maritimibacter dapengensis TaxID=2836868 RepID=A0ABS6T1U4_9RHOB|nr:myo-inosose-2 dehydratase [Maritimibacter dapengensis]MBV7378521.1 myo-inosose-2 dehydratase [Maritimibacter dapengensis]
MIRFGTNPIAWANDDDQSLGANIPTDRILDEAGRQIGFVGIENGHRWPQDDPEALRALLADYGMVFISGWHSLNLLAHSVEDEKAAIQPHLDKLKHNGCTVCIVCETSNSVQGLDQPVSTRVVLSDDEMRDFAAKVEEIAAFCADQGIDLVYHHHMGTVVQSPDDIDRFMAATGPATKLLFDAGHCAFGGGDPAKVLAKYVDRVRHFHAKNVRSEIRDRMDAEGMSFMDGVRAGVFTVPGDQEGSVDFAPLLKILAENGYDGWIVIEAEQDPNQRNPLLYQTLGLATLKRLARETGLIQG